MINNMHVFSTINKWTLNYSKDRVLGGDFRRGTYKEEGLRSTLDRAGI